VRRADNLTTFMCRLSRILGASTSWTPQGLSRPVMGLLYLISLVYAINCYWEAGAGSTGQEVPHTHHVEKTHRWALYWSSWFHPHPYTLLTVHFILKIIFSFHIYRLKPCTCHLYHAYARLQSVHSLWFSSFSFITSSVILYFSFCYLFSLIQCTICASCSL